MSQIIISHGNSTFLDLREEDNLFIVYKMAGPNVSFIQCIPLCIIIVNIPPNSISRNYK